MNIDQKKIEKSLSSSKNSSIVKENSCKKKLKKNHNVEKDIEFLKKQLKEEKEKFIRIFAEFENYKKRIQKEKFDIFRILHEEILVDLIPILDDFERGIKELKKSEEDFLVKGIFLIQEKLIKILEEKGLKKIHTKRGDLFNTDLHEAISQIPAVKKDLKGKIIEIIENGYLLKDKVIRHAKVVTGK
ncbi:nucleotide exchange factor GrpE [Blattabacterium cuenoti]|uniref:nucleotide exchange factor GrpE n=1 Tax=Blattabacterium cuenoti TaxID=1653831 RepID=UPI00163C42D6|nr:nucleotide exchange factor GrpE [Blattabacterium cuenoti]